MTATNAFETLSLRATPKTTMPLITSTLSCHSSAVDVDACRAATPPSPSPLHPPTQRKKASAEPEATAAEEPVAGSSSSRQQQQQAAAAAAVRDELAEHWQQVIARTPSEEAEHVRALAALALKRGDGHEEYDEARFQGRGVVMAAGIFIDI